MIALRRQFGFARPITLLIIAVIISILVAALWVVVRSSMGSSEIRQNISHGSDCSSKPEFALPVRLPSVQSVLYPGQLRGGDYKPHGGFRLDSSSNDAEIKLPVTAKLIDGSRYIEQGEVQYLLEFQTDCKLKLRFDHLSSVSLELLDEIARLPDPKPDDSRTTTLSGKQYDANTTIATKVGFIKTSNATFDFGLYDLNQKNESSKNATWSNNPMHQSENAQYAVCWIDYLNPADKAGIAQLPAGDPTSGKTSDYCK